MNNQVAVITSTDKDFVVSDISLSDFGRREISLAEQEMHENHLRLDYCVTGGDVMFFWVLQTGRAGAA